MEMRQPFHGFRHTPAEIGERARSIWVIVDRLTKCAHFLPINQKMNMDRLADLYVREIVRLHGVSANIVSDRDLRFTLRFW